MSFSTLANSPALLGTQVGNTFRSLKNTSIEKVFQHMNQSNFIEPSEEPKVNQKYVGEMNEFEKSLFTLPRVEKNNDAKEGFAKLLKASVDERYGIEIEGEMIIYTFHRGFQIYAYTQANLMAVG